MHGGNHALHDGFLDFARHAKVVLDDVEDCPVHNLILAVVLDKQFVPCHWLVDELDAELLLNAQVQRLDLWTREEDTHQVEQEWYHPDEASSPDLDLSVPLFNQSLLLCEFLDPAEDQHQEGKAWHE